VSYYKAAVPAEIRIETPGIDADTARFLQGVYENGLGEFAYRNGLSLRGRVRFPVAHAAARWQQRERRVRRNRVLRRRSPVRGNSRRRAPWSRSAAARIRSSASSCCAARAWRRPWPGSADRR
jgi:hypothetical protein